MNGRVENLNGEISNGFWFKYQSLENSNHSNFQVLAFPNFISFLEIPQILLCLYNNWHFKYA